MENLPKPPDTIDKRGVRLEDRAAARKQEKMLREELKKIARARLAVSKHGKKERAKKKLLKEAGVVEGEKIEAEAHTIELAKRILARRKLLEFIKQFHPRYKAGWVHADICRRLEQFAKDVDEGKAPRLMLLMPPRHGKSQIASKLYPAWHLGHYSHHEFIGCSYNVSLAIEFSREVRAVVRSDQYNKLFPQTRLNDEIQAAENWKLASPTGVGAGGYVAAGIGGPITGKGAHVLVIDDPIKNAEEADSPDIRQKIWDWYRSTARTRLAPGGGVLLIMTHWHDDDLAGRLQKDMYENPDDPDVEKFEVIKYPAIAITDEEFRVKGEPLHPERYDLQELSKLKRTLGDRYWAALYQQDPVPEEGAFFKKEYFIFRGETPQLTDMDIYQAWDFAVSDKHMKGNNWTVGVTIGLDHEDTAHVLERVRLKTNDYGIVEDEIINMYARYPRVTAFGGEDGQIWRTMMHSLRRRMKERQVYIAIDEKNPLKAITSKEVRARPLQARMQNKKVTFPRGEEWVDEMMKEFLRFPSGTQDDQIDAMAWCVQLLLGKAPPRGPQKPRNKLEKTVEEQLKVFKSQKYGSKSHMLA